MVRIEIDDPANKPEIAVATALCRRLEYAVPDAPTERGDYSTELSASLWTKRGTPETITG